MPTHTTIFNTRLPLIQAPMAGCQDERLTLAVSAAGALGSLPAATLSATALEAALARLQAAGRPYNVNFFAHRPVRPEPAALARWTERLQPMYRAAGQTVPLERQPGRRAFDEETAEILGAFEPTVVSFHFGLPEARLLERVRATTSALVIASATTLVEAKFLESCGVDAVIAQGLEAGGHRGHFLSTDLSRQLPTEALLAELVPKLRVPVIAAGGINSPALVRRAFELGAAAVQCGTAFLLVPEATTHPLHRQRLKDPDSQSLLTNAFTGGVARSLPNRLTRLFPGVDPGVPPFPWATSAIAPLREWSEARGSDDFTPLWSGANRGALHEGPARDVVHALMTHVLD